MKSTAKQEPQAVVLQLRNASRYFTVAVQRALSSRHAESLNKARLVALLLSLCPSLSLSPTLNGFQ